MSASGLGAFILRSEVIKLYRSCMRSCRQAPTESRGALGWRVAGRVPRARGAQHDAVAPRLALTRGPPAEELRRFVRDGFAVHRTKEAPYDIKYALSDGKAQLKKWKEMLDMRE